MNTFDMDLQLRIIISVAVIAIAYIIDFLCCRLLVPAIRKIASRTTFRWDDHITADGVLRNVFHLIPDSPSPVVPGTDPMGRNFV